MRTVEQRRKYNQKYYNDPEKHKKILEQKKEYHKRHKIVLNKKSKDYYQENKEDWLAKARAYYQIPENRKKKILMKARERARQVGLEFSLSIDDIVLPEYCPYLGIGLTHELGKGQLQSNSSIDRIDNTKGYISGNIRIISRLANNMKTNSTREQREAFAQAVLNDPTL